MIIRVRHEVVAADLALILAVHAEHIADPRDKVRGAKEWIEGRGKREIRNLAWGRLRTTGDNQEYWGEASEEVEDFARAHVNKLWPEGV